MTDNIVDQQVIGPSNPSPKGYRYRVSDVVAFSDGKFAIIYPHSNGAAYTTFVRNGAMQYAPLQVQEGPNLDVQSMRCYNIEERLMVTYNLELWQGIRVINPAGTNYTFPYQMMSGGYKYSQQMVQLENSQTFGICLNIHNGGTNKWDINCLRYTYNPTTMDQTQQNLGVFHSFRAEEQFIWDFIKVAPNRSILMSFSNGAEAPNYASDGVLLYFAEFSDDTTTWNSKTMTAIPGTSNYKYPRIRATGDGGFFLLAVDTDNNTIQCMRFDSSNNISVPEQTVYGFGKNVNYDIQNNVAFAVIVSTKTGEENHLIGIEIDIDTCQRMKDPETICTDEVENYPALAVNSDEGYVFMGIGYNVKTGASTYEYRYSEYMIDLSSGAPCANPRCTGCFNSYTCPICVGSDDANREIRERASGDCTCIDGYYDNYPTDIDCIQCDDTVCGTCNTSPTTCDIFCGEGCARCEITGICKGPTCKTGYLHAPGPPVTCTKCNKKCLNCTGDINTCDGCADGTRDNIQNCNCNVGLYSLVLNETCGQNCNYKCLSCTEVTGTCIDCSDSNRDIGDSCNCIDGYFEDGLNNPTCGKCDDRVCATCNVSAISCDIPCNTGCGRCDLTGACVGSICATGYLHDSGPPVTCTKCTKKCLNCTGDINTCDGCADSTRDNSQNCKCNVGKYSLVSEETCDQNCNYKCLNCAEVTGVCIDCSDSNRDSGDSCNCVDGYYENGVNNPICGKCDETVCATCLTNATTCIISCQEGCSSCDLTGACVGTTCKTGYRFDSGNCIKCNSKCLNCSGDNDTCVGCADSTRDSSQNCSCNVGKYSLVLNETCSQNCSYKCEECEEVNGNCSSCSDVNRDQADSCNCKTGYFENGSNNPTCGKCSHECETCRSENTCDTCSSLTRNLSDNCTCNPRYYNVDEQQDCLQCSDPCGNCTSPTQCITCKFPATRNPPSCECQPGQFESGDDCLSCDHTKCATCVGSPTNCQQACPEGCRLCNTLGECEEIAPGYFNDGSGTLKKCNQNCLQCEEQSDKCTVCRIGLYLDNNKCKQCQEKCSSCTNFDTCETCTNNGIGRSNNIHKNCECIEGYYSDNNTLNCKKCLPHCKICENATECTECLNSKLGKPLCQKIKAGFIKVLDQNKERVQIQCSPHCLKCEHSKDNCTVCNHGQNRNSHLPCRCQEGYHDQDGTNLDCQQCPSLCKSCSNESSCIECQLEESVFYNSFSGLCECMEGYKLKLKENSCQKCYQYLGECLLECPPNTESDEDNYICLGKEMVYRDNIVLIYLGGFSIVFLFGLGSFYSTNIRKFFVKGNDNQNSCRGGKLNDISFENQQLYNEQQQQSILI